MIKYLVHIVVQVEESEIKNKLQERCRSVNADTHTASDTVQHVSIAHSMLLNMPQSKLSSLS